MTQAIDIDSLLDTAIAAHETRDLDRAEHLYRQVLGYRPNDAEALNLLGLILQDRGRAAESIDLIARAIAADPDFADAHANLARGYNLLGRGEEAAAAARRAVALDPDLGEGWLQLGRAHVSLGQARETFEAFDKASAHYPDSVEVNAGLGWSSLVLGDLTAAEAAWRRVLDADPDRIDAMVNLGAVMIRANRLDAALDWHRTAVEKAPRDVSALAALAATYQRLYQPAEMVPLCEAALAIDPARPDILTMLAAAQSWLGRFDDAAGNLETALSLDPDCVPARQLLASVRPSSVDDAAIARFTLYLADPALTIQDRASAGFTIANALDRRRDFADAFRFYQAANNLYRDAARAAGQEYRVEDMLAYTGWARAAFTREVFEIVRPFGNPSEVPVFIVGMPRSGTSLVEQIAASHPDVFGMGERRHIAHITGRLDHGPRSAPVTRWDPEAMRRETGGLLETMHRVSGGARRVIDKMPDNIKALGQIRALFPNARIIVCRRDPRDVCLSNFTNHFGETLNWTWDIEDCARQSVAIDMLMDHWRAVVPGPILEVGYEALVADIEAESRRLIDFLGLDWDPACLSFHETDRPTTTASAVQVRQPLYRGSVGKWRNYEAQLGPMIRILDAGAAGLVPTAAEAPDAEALRLGEEAMLAGRIEDAVTILSNAAAAFPGTHDIHANLALCLGAKGDYQGAIDAWQRALELQPGRHHSLASLGLMLIKIERPADAVAVLRHAIELEPNEFEYHQALAEALWTLQIVPESRDAFRAALALQPSDTHTLVSLGHCEATLGHFDDAARHYRQALTHDPDLSSALTGLIEIGKADGFDSVDNLRALLADTNKAGGVRTWAGFGLGKALETAGDYDGAFDAVDQANKLLLGVRSPEENERIAGELQSMAEHAIAMFSPPVCRALAGRGNPSELPVFIVGTPRSGTTLVEQILSSHRQVHGAGERPEMPLTAARLEQSGDPTQPLSWDPSVVRQEAAALLAGLRALGGGAIRVVDKLPGNILRLGHLRLMFPNARFIVCRRDLRDVAVSCYFSNFVNGLEWSNDLREIAAYINSVHRLTRHWRAVLPGPIMELRYEDLVADLETESRRLIDFLGLEWDPACLEFHRTDRAVMTASVWQVRQKIYDSSMGRWRHYERHLGPLLEGLDELTV